MKVSIIVFAMLVAMTAASVMVLHGCSSDNGNESPVGPVDADYTASGTFTSATGGVVETVSGARIAIPRGAVPQTTTGEIGTMVFSIERDTEWEIAPPEGYTLVSDVYRFGPSGFVLAAPVQIGIPVSESYGPGEVMVYQIDYTTGEYIPSGGSYDDETGTVATQTYELSRWFVMAPNTDNPTDWGCIHMVNSSNCWIGACVEGFELEYPEYDLEIIQEEAPSCFMAPFGGGHSVTNYVWWRVPQGTYEVCIQYMPADSEFTFGNYTVTIDVRNPWNRVNPTAVDYPITGCQWPPPTEEDRGRCPCVDTPTPAVGTGQIQATLTWYDELAIDLDLWVTDPDSVRCWYANSTTSSGGTLDRDNRCSNYENGRPENIFWQQAPGGEYVVEVDWYSDCGNGITSESFDVRVVANGRAQTYNGTIATDQTIEVTRFTVGPSGALGPFIGMPVDVDAGASPKKE